MALGVESSDPARFLLVLDGSVGQLGLGSECFVVFYCGKGCYISIWIGLQRVPGRRAAWGGISP